MDDYWFKIVIINKRTGSLVHEEVYKQEKRVLFKTLAQASFMAGCALTGFITEFEQYDVEDYMCQVHVFQFDVKVIEFNWR